VIESVLKTFDLSVEELVINYMRKDNEDRLQLRRRRSQAGYRP
jgi:hypothetical protein